MNDLNKICKSYCISDVNPENRFNYTLSKVNSSLISDTEILNYFTDKSNKEDKVELFSNYRVWKNLSLAKGDQYYFIFNGCEKMPEGFKTIWDNFISKELPKDFFLCLIGGYTKEFANSVNTKSYNDYFCQLAPNSSTDSISYPFYIISKSAANLICQHISNEGFGSYDQNFLVNFFIKNKFFSSSQNIYLLKDPIKESSKSSNDFYYTKDILFEKRTTFVDMAREWGSLIKEQDLEVWLNNRPHLPAITPPSYPHPPSETFSCYNPGKATAMVMLYTEQTKSYSYQSEISVKNYCLKNDYSLYVYRDSIDKESFPSWSKPEALLNHIDDHDNIVWIDSDTLIFDPCFKLEWIIDGDCTFFKKFILSEDLGGHNYINSGVIMCRNSDYTKVILNRWRDFKKEHDTSSLYASEGDQVVLGNIIKKSDVFKYNHKIFPMSKFNTDPRLVNWNTFIIHFMAYPNHLKNYFMNFWNHGFPIYK